MTCIVAQKSKNGAVMVADRRVLTGYEAEDQEKMFILPNGAVVGAAGAKFMMDNFLPQMKEIEAKDFTSLCMRAEDIIYELYKRYRSRFGEYWPGLSVLIMGLDKLTSGAPRIKVIEENGVSEEVDKAQLVGHGAPYATPFVRLLHDEDSSVIHMWRGAYFAISMIENLELDESVGGDPDVIVLEKDAKPKLLSYDELQSSEGGPVIDAHVSDWQDVAAWYLKKVAFQTGEAETVYMRYYRNEEDFSVLAEKAREEFMAMLRPVRSSEGPTPSQ